MVKLFRVTYTDEANKESTKILKGINPQWIRDNWTLIMCSTAVKLQRVEEV